MKSTLLFSAVLFNAHPSQQIKQIPPLKEVQRSFWSLPAILQNTTSIEYEHEYCMLVYKHQEIMDQHYVAGCDQWIDKYFYKTFDVVAIETDKLVNVSQMKQGITFSLIFKII